MWQVDLVRVDLAAIDLVRIDLVKGSPLKLVGFVYASRCVNGFSLCPNKSMGPLRR